MTTNFEAYRITITFFEDHQPEYPVRNVRQSFVTTCKSDNRRTAKEWALDELQRERVTVGYEIESVTVELADTNQAELDKLTKRDPATDKCSLEHMCEELRSHLDLAAIAKTRAEYDEWITEARINIEALIRLAPTPLPFGVLNDAETCRVIGPATEAQLYASKRDADTEGNFMFKDRRVYIDEVGS